VARQTFDEGYGEEGRMKEPWPDYHVALILSPCWLTVHFVSDGMFSIAALVLAFLLGVCVLLYQLTMVLEWLAWRRRRSNG
jgi:hypothetical protein